MAAGGNGAQRQRAIAAESGLKAVALDLCDRFAPPPAG
jgi:hypothetical protein